MGKHRTSQGGNANDSPTFQAFGITPSLNTMLLCLVCLDVVILCLAVVIRGLWQASL